ncbi:MAG TPA: hypothetical protein IAA05_06090 [Candidatus Blautia excrementipullorum]|nr:hypothetical protein [Candidatus Blautia excrementipullorum]
MIADRPVLITLPVAAVFLWVMINANCLNTAEFFAEAPVVPITVFILMIFSLCWRLIISAAKNPEM